MFHSVRWKFITIYFLLVLISMAIVAVFILDRLESQELASVEKNMQQTIETVVQTSSTLGKDNWYDNHEVIQRILDGWRIAATDSIYAISMREGSPIIVATSMFGDMRDFGSNANANKNLSAELIGNAFAGTKSTAQYSVEDTGSEMHLAYPVYGNAQNITGILYMTSNLSSVIETTNKVKVILSNATIIALVSTVALGIILSQTITGPIRDVTSKARDMASGNFDQRVEVKSDDEIGQLGAMFNHLTRELSFTMNAIESEKSKLDTIFTHMAEGVVAFDEKGELIKLNPAAAAIIGNLDSEHSTITPELIGIKNIDFSKPESGDEFVEIRGGYYNVKYAPYRDDIGASKGLIAVLQDVTKEHRLDIMRKDFVANVSHELKTPLTAIKSYTETMIDMELDSDTRKGFLNIINSESDRMANLVKDLLQLSNLDHNASGWEYEEFDICELIDSIAVKLKLLIAEKGHDFEFIRSNSVLVNANKSAIEQVLINIITNAIKYTDNGGKIRIDARCVRDMARISVSDNGIGIPEEDISRIFERFYRVEKGRSREMGGTGLGLSIAKEIIDAHGGKIDISSKFGEGTTITLNLPLKVSQ